MRISIDAKVAISLGRFSRNGVSRVVVKGLDHDFTHGAASTLTPLGLYLPQYQEVFLYFVSSKVTSDCIADCLCDLWQNLRHRFPKVRSLVINQDNGPEQHSRRTQMMLRLTPFSDTFQIPILLAYYPPYHSKYNPIERIWGHLEKHWNGALLDSIDTVLAFARSFRFHQRPPHVQLLSKPYPTGVTLSPRQMACLEQRFLRLPGLEKYLVSIAPLPCLSG